MPKPVCVPCQRFFKPSHNGKTFIEAMPISGNQAPPGTRAPEYWTPYKLWIGDEWTCPDCGSTIIVGCGSQPVSEHYLPDFREKMVKFRPDVQVNDC